MATKKEIVIKSQLKYEVVEPSQLTINFFGKLNADTINQLWKDAFALRNKFTPQILALDVKNVEYCDSIGAILLIELEKQQIKAGKKFQLLNPSPDLQKVVNFLQAQTVLAQPPKIKKPDFFSRVGKSLVETVAEVRSNIVFTGALVTHLFGLILHPKSIRWPDFWRAMDDIGPKALPIIFLIGFLVGVIITFQSAEPFSRFGTQIYIIDLVGLGLIREMG